MGRIRPKRETVQVIYRLPVPVMEAILKDLAESGFDGGRINFNLLMRKWACGYAAHFEKLSDKSKHDMQRYLDKKDKGMMPPKGRLPKYWFMKRHLLAPMPKDFLTRDYLLFSELDENLRAGRIIDQLREQNQVLQQELLKATDEIDALRNGEKPARQGKPVSVNI